MELIVRWLRPHREGAMSRNLRSEAIYSAITVLVGLLAVGCSSNSQDSAVPPLGVIIDSISPTFGVLGSEVTIHGSGFTVEGNDVAFGSIDTENRGSNTLYLNGLPSRDGATLLFRLPDNEDVLLASCAFSQLGPNEECPGSGYALPTGVSRIWVLNEVGESNAVIFRVSKTDDP